MYRFPLLVTAASMLIGLTAHAAPVLAANASEQHPAPVSVDACRAYTMTAGKAPKHSNVEISFQNHGTAPANAVAFLVNWGDGVVQRIRDAGTFSPGVTVRHSFVHTGPDASAELFRRPPVSCEVESVHLNDGSEWRRVPGGQS